jgi:molybdenum cofactor cytidylyltransferase
VDRVIVVAGFQWERIRGLFQGEDIRVVFNRQYQEGMAASIREGLRHLEPDCHGVLIALADQPMMTSRLIDRLIDAYRRSNKGIVCPTYMGRRGHPVIFNVESYGEALLELKGDTGGRAVICAHSKDLQEVAVDSPAVIRDIDLLEDYEALQKEGSRHSDRRPKS